MLPDKITFKSMPAQTMVGVDALMLTTRNFCGIKNIPAGAHLVWSSESDKSMRSGFWIVTDGSGKTHVVQWDDHVEAFVEASVPEKSGKVVSVKVAYDESLLDYQAPPTETPSEGRAAIFEDGLWSRVTSCISSAVLKRVYDSPKSIWVCHTTDRPKGTTENAAEAAMNESLAGNLSQDMMERKITFTMALDERTFDADLQGAERTEAARDSTRYILNKAASITNETDLIGELQISYLLGMHLGNHGALEEWWFMVLKIFLKAHSLTQTRPRLTALFLRTLAAQVQYGTILLDNSIFEHNANKTKDMQLAVTVYGRRLEELLSPDAKPPGPQAKITPTQSDSIGVLAAWDNLKRVLEDIGWEVSGNYVRSGRITLPDGDIVEVDIPDLEDEDERGDYAPALVELDEDGRPTDMVSWN